jgi:hypothetical protein
MWRTIALWTSTFALAAAGLAEKPHPRLWLPASAEPALREKLAADPLAAKLHSAAMAEADRVLKERTCRYEIPDGKRLLGESRRALNNVMHCAWAWRLSGDEKYRLRAIAELDAASALKDWNPSHFLDVAEMAAAVATGYDWLHSTLTPEQRKTYERAMIEKALKPAKKVYDSGGWWSNPRNNWAQVCGAGIALAAATVAGNDDGLAEDLFSSGLKLVEDCTKFYEPDGMYPEGPGYWHYGTNYHVMMLAACQPLDSTFKDSPLLRKSGDAIMHLTSPTRLSFNFADGSARPETPSAAQCWLAAHYKDIPQTRHVRGLFSRILDDKGRVSGDRYFPLAILWLPEEPKAGTPLPNAAVFHGEQAMALFRSGWDPQAAWLAIKGGTAAASHGHMDAGSFCYDAHGTRWIHDLGSDNYNMPGYFGSRRWDYFRMQNRSHNTLEIDGKLQNPKAKPCPLVSSSIKGNPFTATFDLSDAYHGSARKIIRSARFQPDTGSTTIFDEIEAPAGDVVWRAFTDAGCEIMGDRVILTKKDRHITLRRVSKSGTWSITDATPPTSRERQNKGVKAIVLTVHKASRLAIEVEIQP